MAHFIKNHEPIKPPHYWDEIITVDDTLVLFTCYTGEELWAI